MSSKPLQPFGIQIENGTPFELHVSLTNKFSTGCRVMYAEEDDDVSTTEVTLERANILQPSSFLFFQNINSIECRVDSAAVLRAHTEGSRCMEIQIFASSASDDPVSYTHLTLPTKA